MTATSVFHSLMFNDLILLNGYLLASRHSINCNLIGEFHKKFLDGLNIFKAYSVLPSIQSRGSLTVGNLKEKDVKRLLN